jgi:hypothetical protein
MNLFFVQYRAEIYKRISNQGIDPAVYFWRTSTGTEVDLLVDTQGKLIPIEIKSTSTPKPSMAEAISMFRKDLGQKTSPGYVIHLGDLSLPLANQVLALPFAQL